MLVIVLLEAVLDEFCEYDDVVALINSFRTLEKQFRVELEGLTKKDHFLVVSWPGLNQLQMDLPQCKMCHCILSFCHFSSKYSPSFYFSSVPHRFLSERTFNSQRIHSLHHLALFFFRWFASHIFEPFSFWRTSGW